MFNLWRKVYRRESEFVFHQAKSERVFVRDADGIVEVDNADYVWADPITYVWVSADIRDNVMYYLFDLEGPG